MNKKVSLFIVGLLILSGVLFFFSSSDPQTGTEEASDAVVIIEKTKPQETSAPDSDSSITETDKNAAAADPEEIAFAEEAQEILDSTPLTLDLQALPEAEVHHTPMVLRKQGEKIGILMEKAETTPKLRAHAMKFLLGCAEKEEAAPSIRALCWNKLVKNIPRWKIFVPLMDAKVSQDIKDLASRL